MKTLLVVEDNQLSQYLYKTRFSKKYDVLLADSFNSAKDVVNRSDLVVTDIDLNGDLNGYDLIDYIGSNFPSKPIIVVASSFSYEKVNREVLFYKKPIFLSGLESVIDESLQNFIS